MADFVVGGRLGLKDDGAAQTVGNFKKELREASKSLLDVQSKFGATSAEALQAAKKVAALKDSIQEAREVAQLFDPGAKFQAFGNVVRTVAGGFSALTGTMALFGTESKEVEQALLKVQGAMALTEGLNTIADAGKDFTRLGAILKGGFMNAIKAVQGAFVGLRGAIIATGLGALAVGIGLLIANFDKVKQVVLNLFPGLGKLASFFGDLIQKVTDFVGITSEADRALDRLSASTERANETIQGRIKVLQAMGGKEAEIYKLSQQQAENELNVLRQTLKTKGELNDEELKRFRELKTEKAVLDAQETKRLNDKHKQEADAARSAAEKASAEAAARRQKERERIAQEQEAIRENQAAIVKAEREMRAESKQAEIEEFKEFEAQLREQEEAAAEAKRAREKADEDAADAAFEKYKQQQKEAADLAKLRAEQETQAYRDIGSALGALSDIIGKETAAGKALAIAQAVINTWLGVTQVLAAKSVLPEPIATISKIANVVAIAAAGFSAVKNIVKTPIPGGRGGGGGGAASISAPAPIQPQAQVTNTRLDQNSLNQIGNAANRAYVLESDVSSQQERVTRLNRAARLG